MANLANMKRHELRSLAKALGIKTTNFSSNADIIQDIGELNPSQEQIDNILMDIQTINKNTPQEQTDKTLTHLDAPNSTYQPLGSRQHYLSEVDKAKKRALEPVICYITPNSEIDMAASNCATIQVSSMCGISLSLAVPFNAHCEVPRCIAEQAQEIMMHRYEENKNSHIGIAKQLGRAFRVKKYNVQITERDQWFKTHNVPPHVITNSI